MTPLRCIAADDEPLALAQLRKYIDRTPDVELVDLCYDAAEVLESLRRNQNIDVLFLDINMPDMSGMELARRLEQSSPLIIFTTAYSEYAIEGFKVDAVDYLLKPYSYDDFTAAVERAHRRLRPAEPRDTMLYIKASGSTRRVAMNDIRMIKGLAEYVQFFLKSQHNPITTLMSMRSLEQSLPPERFMRVHRSYIINLEHVEEVVDRSKVKVAGEIVPISDSYREKFLDYINSLTVKTLNGK